MGEEGVFLRESSMSKKIANPIATPARLLAVMFSFIAALGMETAVDILAYCATLPTK
jgi:hypothetical protein